MGACCVGLYVGDGSFVSVPELARESAVLATNDHPQTFQPLPRTRLAGITEAWLR